jgi:hypothetical protein
MGLKKCSGFTRCFPTEVSSGFTRRLPTEVSSGFTRRLPTEVSSGFTRRLSTEVSSGYNVRLIKVLNFWNDLNIWSCSKWTIYIYISISVTNDNRYVHLVLITTPPFPHSWNITRFVYKNNTTGATYWAEITHPSWAHEFTSWFCGICVVQSLVFCVVFSRSLFVLLFFFLWLLHCLPFFNLRLLIAPLIFSNFSSYYCRLD